MPFNGGGGGALPAHEHTNIANDGGPLDFNNTTVGSMNSGDLTYSDGAALQQLAITAPNDQLRVSAGNIPEWFTPAGPAGSTWSLVAENTLTVAASDMGVFWSVADQCDYYQAWVLTEFGGGALARRYLNFSTDGATYDTAAVYATRYSINFGAMGTATAGTGISSATGTLGNQFSCFHIQDANTTSATTTWDWAVTNSSNTGGTAPDQTVFTAGVYGNTANIRGINISDGGAGTTFAVGSSIIVVGLKLT